MVANKLKQILNSGNHHNSLKKKWPYVTKQLNHKTVTENAITLEGDKGKTVAIINSDQYSKNVHSADVHNVGFHSVHIYWMYFQYGLWIGLTMA